jgi:hypothetical protein
MPVAFAQTPAAYTETCPNIEVGGKFGFSSFEDAMRLVVRRRIGQSGADPQSSTELNQDESIDPVVQHIAKLAGQYYLEQQTKNEIEERLRDLRIEAELNDEPFSDLSADDLRSFLASLKLTRRPSIFLLDNGNLRILWRNDAKEQVGIQFLGIGVVQFVMFVLRRDPALMMREAGVDVLSAMRPKIAAAGSEHVIFG